MLVVGPQLAWAETDSLHSGNGTVGGTDSQITMLIGPSDSAFGAAFTSTEFIAASSGPNAFIIDNHPLWKEHLTSDPSAEWISTFATGASEGSTALYAIDFTIDSACFSSSTLDFSFLVDNQLGDSNNEGLFVNEIPVANSKLLGTNTAHFQVDQSFPTFDITSHVNTGLNTLYINAVDTGGPSGLQFNATINVEEIACPQPTPVGGELMNIDMSSLFIAGASANVYWMLPTFVGMVGAAIAALISLRRK
jgi:hypothetical protein